MNCQARLFQNRAYAANAILAIHGGHRDWSGFSQMWDPFYFVTFNTYKRLQLLARPEIHETVCLFCHRAHEHNVAVGRYVLMPDHVHLFVALPSEGQALPNWIQALRSVVGKSLLQLDFQKPHWQEGFFDHLLRSGENYAQKWDYVRMNPVRAGLSETPETWPYQGEIISLRFD